MNDDEVELHDDIDPTKLEASLDEIIEPEIEDPISLLADEISDDPEDENEDEELVAQLMNPYELND